MNSIPSHPLQSSAWTEFRRKSNVKVVEIDDGFAMSVHLLHGLSLNIGYIPKCPIPTEQIISKIKKAGIDNQCIFVKLEPNALIHSNYSIISNQYSLRKSPHPNFYEHSFHIDLTLSETQLLKNMKSKTRYNIHVAEKHEVTVREDNSPEAFEQYINLSKKTWQRKGFRAHGEEYHRNMWDKMHKAGIAHLLIASYKPVINGKQPATEVPLTAWILFLYKDVLYYPYGASSDEYKHTMASNLMMWEAMKWGKKHGAKLFDLWGCLGPNPDKNHPWYGFHKFKEGYGGEMVEYIGSYDLVINPVLYKIYNVLYPIRQKLLGLQ